MFQRIQKKEAKKEKDRIKQMQDEDPRAAKRKAQKEKRASLKGKSGEALAQAMLQNELGVDGCLACRARKCRWLPSVDMPVCQARITLLEEEMRNVRADKETKVICDSDCIVLCSSVSHFSRREIPIHRLNPRPHTRLNPRLNPRPNPSDRRTLSGVRVRHSPFGPTGRKPLLPQG